MPGGESKMKCPTCGKEFKHQCNVQRHVREVHGVKKFNCDKCDKGFARKEKLTRYTLLSGIVCYQVTC